MCLTFNGENKTLVLICNSILVTLSYPIYKEIIGEIARWCDTIKQFNYIAN